MRGRILWAVLIAAAALAGCSKKDSLYIEPGKAGAAQPPEHHAPTPAKAAPDAPAKPAPKS